VHSAWLNVATYALSWWGNNRENIDIFSLLFPIPTIIDTYAPQGRVGNNIKKYRYIFSIISHPILINIFPTLINIIST